MNWRDYQKKIEGVSNNSRDGSKLSAEFMEVFLIAYFQTREIANAAMLYKYLYLLLYFKI